MKNTMAKKLIFLIKRTWFLENVIQNTNNITPVYTGVLTKDLLCENHLSTKNIILFKNTLPLKLEESKREHSQDFYKKVYINNPILKL